MNDRGYLMMEAVSSLLLVSCLGVVGLPVLCSLHQEAAATRQMLKGGELLENRLAMGESSFVETVLVDKTTYALKGHALRDGFSEVCVSFRAANGREYERCGIINAGMNSE
ncbi:hypothetical protein [Fictibacillus iocasae]